MKPCVIPVLTGNHSEIWSFDRPLWNPLLKKLWITLERESETPMILWRDTTYEETHYEFEEWDKHQKL